MSKERADLGFGDALDEFDPTEWSPSKDRSASQRPEGAATARAAEVAGFRSREPKQIEQPAKGAAEGGVQRRRRTGRNAQFNLKAKPETIEAFCAIADQMGWGLGETFEKAVGLLLREYEP